MSGTFRVVGITSDAPKAAEAYWNSLELPPLHFAEADIHSMGIRLTPALIIVDAKGRVVKSWAGAKLSDSDKTEIRRQLEIPENDALQPEARIDGQDGQRTRDQQRNLADMSDVANHRTEGHIVDVRGQLAFAAAHIAGSISMPLQDVKEEAPRMLRTDEAVIVMCGACKSCGTDQAIRLHELCTAAFSTFRELGFEHVRMLRESIEAVRASGVKVVHGDESAQLRGR